MALLEVCCFTPGSAILAYEAGADRIELCTDREAGGTIPPFEWLADVQRHVRIPVFVMIRPRGGDFTYSSTEFDQMKRDINAFKFQANGYVFGMLDGDRRVDVVRTAELVKAAAPLPCTFHKAFDETPDLFVALEDVLATGCSAILTSGGAPSAPAGIETLEELVRTAQKRLTIMPGGSVRASNISTIRALTGASIFHSSAVPRGATEPSASEIRELKALLREDIVQTPLPVKTPSPTASQSSGEDGLSSDMLMSAVSIGAAPADNRHHSF
ncbi:hypothetical protein B0A55_12138 [Friedmanniomyces simplex]|uniref:Copper homeostasis protein cutC homolog n=1 Tax=Friedmanniomyces simplex TaxID=329884 RepID=A0A4U0WBB1_9PEZI|nr:hypothetical protein B0A55_12138 [Friedmanniomyces simplex]